MTVKDLSELPTLEAPLISIDEFSSMDKTKEIQSSEAPNVMPTKVDIMNTTIQQKVANGTPLSVEEKLIVFAEEHDKFLDTVGAVSGRTYSFPGRCASAWENRFFKLIPDIRELV